MKEYKGIDYSQRPASYWQDPDALSAILRNVKGRARRELIEKYWREGRVEELREELLQEDLGTASRLALGRLHPSLMGGEYLPGYQPGEVEIARIELASVMMDVISIRARPVPEGIAYRVVDEYKEVYRIPQETSAEPLTLGELVNLIEKGGHRDLPGNLAVGFNEFNLVGQPHSACRHFTSICSRLYPQLYAHFEHVFDDWAREDEPDPEEDVQAEEDEEMAGPGEGRNADD